MRVKLHPLLLLSAAISCNICALGFSRVPVSLSVLAVVFVATAIFGGLKHTLLLMFSGVLLVAPVVASTFLVHLAHAGGAAPSLNFACRLAACTLSILAAMSLTTVPELVKAFQQAHLPPQLCFVLAQTMHLLPQARAQLSQLQQLARLEGINVKRPVAAFQFVAVPLVTRLLSGSLDRAFVLDQLQVSAPGRRTLVRPARAGLVQKALAVALPVVSLGVVLLCS